MTYEKTQRLLYKLFNYFCMERSRLFNWLNDIWVSKYLYFPNIFSLFNLVYTNKSIIFQNKCCFMFYIYVISIIQTLFKVSFIHLSFWSINAKFYFIFIKYFKMSFTIIVNYYESWYINKDNFVKKMLCSFIFLTIILIIVN